MLIHKAFLEIRVSIEVMPLEYMNAISEHLASEPTPFYLPLPTSVAIAKGDKFYFSCLPSPFEDSWVAEITHLYDNESGIQTIATLVPIGEVLSKRGSGLVLEDFLCFSEEGFLLESRHPIQEVLQAAGLPSTNEEYRAKYGT